MKIASGRNTTELDVDGTTGNILRDFRGYIKAERYSMSLTIFLEEEKTNRIVFFMYRNINYIISQGIDKGNQKLERKKKGEGKRKVKCMKKPQNSKKRSMVKTSGNS